MRKLINWRQLVQVSEQGRKFDKMKQISFGCGCIVFYFVMIISIELHSYIIGRIQFDCEVIYM